MNPSNRSEGKKVPQLGNAALLTTVSLSRHIAAPTEKVWELISKPGHLADCHPFCEKNLVEKWPGVGAKDAVHFYSGKVINRYFNKWVKGVGYNLHLTIQDLDTHQANVTFQISSFKERVSESVLLITIQINALPKSTPWFIRRLLAHFTLRPSLKKYLDSVLKGYEYYITTGQAVKRNQFGSHSLFSRAIN